MGYRDYIGDYHIPGYTYIRVRRISRQQAAQHGVNIQSHPYIVSWQNAVTMTEWIVPYAERDLWRNIDRDKAWKFKYPVTMVYPDGI